MRTDEEGVLCLFERTNGKLAAHRRKVVEERIQRLAAFGVVEQRLERHAGSREHGGAAGLTIKPFLPVNNLRASASAIARRNRTGGVQLLRGFGGSGTSTSA